MATQVVGGKNLSGGSCTGMPDVAQKAIGVTKKLGAANRSGLKSPAAKPISMGKR